MSLKEHQRICNLNHTSATASTLYFLPPPVSPEASLCVSPFLHNIKIYFIPRVSSFSNSFPFLSCLIGVTLDIIQIPCSDSSSLITMICIIRPKNLGQGFFFWVWRTALYFNIIGFSYKHRQFVLCIYKLHAEKRPIGFSKFPKKPMMQNTYWRNSESKEKEGGNWKCLLVFIPSFFLHSFLVSESH